MAGNWYLAASLLGFLTEKHSFPEKTVKQQFRQIHLDLWAISNSTFRFSPVPELPIHLCCFPLKLPEPLFPKFTHHLQIFWQSMESVLCKEKWLQQEHSFFPLCLQALGCTLQLARSWARGSSPAAAGELLAGSLLRNRYTRLGQHSAWPLHPIPLTSNVLFLLSRN